MSILSNGNVGIGTTTPTSTLDVSGNTSISGNLSVKASATTSTTSKVPVFISDPASQTLVTRTSAEFRGDIGAASTTVSGLVNTTTQSFAGNKTFNFILSSTLRILSSDSERYCTMLIPTTNNQTRLNFVGRYSGTSYNNGYIGLLQNNNPSLNFTGQHRAFIKDIPYTSI